MKISASFSFLAFAVTLAALAPTGFASAQNPAYIFDLSDALVTPGEDAALTNSVTNMGGNIQGFSFGVCSDPALASYFDYELLPAMTSLNGGAGPDWFSTAVLPNGAGFCCGTVLDLHGAVVLPPVTALPLITMYYHTPTTAEGSAEVWFCDTVGTPPVATIVVVGGSSIVPVVDPGTIHFAPPPVFLRGDSNVDGTVNIADAITVLNYLFTSGPGHCLGAMDANFDAQVDIADALSLLLYINGQGAAPATPFPLCGPALGSTLPCGSPPSCP